MAWYEDGPRDAIAWFLTIVCLIIIAIAALFGG